MPRLGTVRASSTALAFPRADSRRAQVLIDRLARHGWLDAAIGWGSVAASRRRVASRLPESQTSDRRVPDPGTSQQQHAQRPRTRPRLYRTTLRFPCVARLLSFLNFQIVLYRNLSRAIAPDIGKRYRPSEYLRFPKVKLMRNN